MRTPNFKHTLFLGTSIATLAWAVAPALAQNNGNQGNETVIVTGTRVQGMTAADSAAPITVLGTDALTHGTGSTDLRDALGQAVPSFTAQQFGGDTANLTLSAALRGLSPNDTLVLINGKRRHYTGNLHVGGGDFAGGSSSADLSMIPQAAIDHVEVLLDGAAAQYGTDAVVGVVNMILKKKSSGGQLSATYGDYYDRGHRSPADNGEKYSVSVNVGLPLFDKGFANITVEKQYGNFTQYGGADARYLTAQGTVVPQATVNSVGANGVAVLRTPTTTPPGQVGNQIPNSFLPTVLGYPRANAINGKPEYQLTMGVVNAGYDFSDNLSLYATGTVGHKFAKSMENDRLPNQIIATLGSNQPCSATNLVGYNTGSSTANGLTPSCVGPFNLAGSIAAPGTAGAGLNNKGIIVSSGNAGNLFSSTLINANNGAALPPATGAGTLGTMPELVFRPNGFRPMEVLKEEDYQYNVGVKFNVLGWDMDANVGYGKDIDRIFTYDSANRSLFIDTHTTPSNFYDGAFTASQFTGTLDATHAFNVGMASPLTVAVGIEAREDLYGISQGEPNSFYKEGAQSFPGFTDTAAGAHSRKNYAAYVDFALAPVEELQLDFAGRAEHYTDFGDTQIGKITARYDFSPAFGIRGTISTGFRAPTLAEEFYTAVNVSPTSATVQLPADSSAAQLLGLNGLTPEISTSSSVGFVAHPFGDMTVTVDAYNIAIGHRITTSATVTSAGGAINTTLVTAAITAVGVQLDPTATQQGVTAFLNGIATGTQGVDVVISYPTDLVDYGLIDWTLAGNFNETHISSVLPPPAVLLASNSSASFFRADTLYNFVNSAPKEKIGLTANWSLDSLGFTFRETYYGPRHGTTTPNNGGVIIPQNQAGVGLTDMEGRYNITEGLQFSIGANNVFNIRPDRQGFATTSAFLNGNNNTTGVSVPAGNGSVQNTFLNTAFDPNGGYYYGRLTYNF